MSVAATRLAVCSTVVVTESMLNLSAAGGEKIDKKCCGPFFFPHQETGAFSFLLALNRSALQRNHRGLLRCVGADYVPAVAVTAAWLRGCITRESVLLITSPPAELLSSDDALHFFRRRGARADSAG